MTTLFSQNYNGGVEFHRDQDRKRLFARAVWNNHYNAFLLELVNQDEDLLGVTFHHGCIKAIEFLALAALAQVQHVNREGA